MGLTTPLLAARRRALVPALVASIVFSTFPVAAQEPEATTKSAAAAAKELYAAGVDLTAQRKFPEAEAKFLKAWELQKGYDVAANLGEISMQLDKPAEAAFYFTFALASFPASGQQAKLEWLENRLKEARAKSAAVKVTVNVPGADVRINGKPAGKAPIDGELFVPPGDCTVEVTAPDLEPFKRTIRATAGGSHEMRAELVPPAMSPVPGLVGGGVGLAGFVAGLALYLISNDKYDQAKELHDEIAAGSGGARHCVEGQGPNPKCADLKSAAEASDALYGPGVGLMVGGAILAAAGGAYFGYTLSSAPQPASASRPVVTRVGVRGAGVFLQGTF